ncbi:MAG: twin-arginine translocase TatA/TatE family subunit [Anaerolineae bacterium]
MPHLGLPELLIILVIVIVIFGVGKLPQIGGAIGQSIREFRTATKDNKDTNPSDEADKPTSGRKESRVRDEAEEEDKPA